MTDIQVDYMSVFQNLPTPMLLLSLDFRVIDMNYAYQRISGRSREELVGRIVFETFPDNPSEPGVSGMGNLAESLRRVIATGKPDMMALQRHDTEAIDHPGEFSERYWYPVNVPVPGPGGQVACISHAVEEIPDLIKKFVEAEAAGA